MLWCGKKERRNSLESNHDFHSSSCVIGGYSRSRQSTPHSKPVPGVYRHGRTVKLVKLYIDTYSAGLRRKELYLFHTESSTLRTSSSLQIRLDERTDRLSRPAYNAVPLSKFARILRRSARGDRADQDVTRREMGRQTYSLVYLSKYLATFLLNTLFLSLM